MPTKKLMYYVSFFYTFYVIYTKLPIFGNFSNLWEYNYKNSLIFCFIDYYKICRLVGLFV